MVTKPSRNGRSIACGSTFMASRTSRANHHATGSREITLGFGGARNRISGPQETEELGLREILGGPGVTVVEWGDRLGEEPEGAVRVRIEILGDQDRAFHFAGIDP